MTSLAPRRKPSLSSFPRFYHRQRQRISQGIFSSRDHPTGCSNDYSHGCKLPLEGESLSSSFSSSPSSSCPCLCQTKCVLTWKSLLESLLHWPFFLHLIALMFFEWFAGYVQFNCLFSIFCGAFYLHEVDRRHKERFQAKLKRQMEEDHSKSKPYTDIESMEWFNALMEKIWPSWLELMLSKMVAECLHANLPPFMPQALSKFSVSRLRLGSSHPIIKSAKVYRVHDKVSQSELLRQKTFPLDQEVILELDVSYVSGDDMGVEFSTKMMGIEWRLVGNNLSVEGKLRLGLKFVPYYPYVALLKVSFAETPELRLSIRPLSSNSVDVLDLPGVASWVHRSMRESITEAMVEPRQLEFDLLKLLGADYGGTTALHFMKDGHIRHPKHVEVAFAIVEVLEAQGIEQKDPNGFLDPYVRIQMCRLKLQTSVKRRTVNPAWNEFFRLRIASWDTSPTVRFSVKDRDIFGTNNVLGHCTLDLSKYRDGYRHDLWLGFDDSKPGQLRVAVTIVDEKRCQSLSNLNPLMKETSTTSTSSVDSHVEICTLLPSLSSATMESLSDSRGSSPSRSTPPIGTKSITKMSPSERRKALFYKVEGGRLSDREQAQASNGEGDSNLEDFPRVVSGGGNELEQILVGDIGDQQKKKNPFTHWFLSKLEQPMNSGSSRSISKNTGFESDFQGRSQTTPGSKLIRSSSGDLTSSLRSFSESLSSKRHSFDGIEDPILRAERGIASEKELSLPFLAVIDPEEKHRTSTVSENAVRRRSLSQTEVVTACSNDESVEGTKIETWEVPSRNVAFGTSPMVMSSQDPSTTMASRGTRRERRPMFPSSVKAELVDLCSRLKSSNSREHLRGRRRSLSPPPRTGLKGRGMKIGPRKGAFRDHLDALYLEFPRRITAFDTNRTNTPELPNL